MNKEKRAEAIRQVLKAIACDLKTGSEFYASMVVNGINHEEKAYFQGASDVLARKAQKIADMAKRI
jgi:hypothetical protein